MTNIQELSAAVIKGHAVTLDEARELLSADCFELLHAANGIRRHFKGDKVHLCSIINAKSGLCSEDCRYCAQSAHHPTGVTEYPLVGNEQIAQAMDAAHDYGARCFGIVTSGNRISKQEIESICSVAGARTEDGMTVSVSLGEVGREALGRLKESGVKRFHHNLETAESFFPSICTTHTYQERVATIRGAKEAGLEVCSGGICGLGETPEQRIELAFALRGLGVDSVPLNFLNPIAGTPLEHQQKLSPFEILRTIALFRFILPRQDISVCGGREVNLGDYQSWIFYAGANGMMVGGYLTTPGRSVEKDVEMIAAMGLSLA